MLQRKLIFKFEDTIKYSDGFIDPRRVEVVPFDSDQDNSYDDPDIFDYLTYNPSSLNHYVFYVKEYDQTGFAQNVPTKKIFI
jgi:hypothetical protein